MHCAAAAATGAYDAQEFATSVAPELSMQTVPSLNITYTEEKVRCCGCGGVVGLARGVVRGAGVVEGLEECDEFSMDSYK